MTLLARLAAHLTDNEAPVALQAPRSMGRLEFVASSHWGREAPDSPMVGAAAYGIGDTLPEALETMLAQAGYPAPAVDPPAPDAFVFDPDDDGTLRLATAIFQALGAASACWETLDGAGVFQSDRAKAIGEELLRLLCAAGLQRDTVLAVSAR